VATKHTPRKTPQHHQAEAIEAAEHDALETEVTHIMPRIESAVPAGPDPFDGTARRDRMPRIRVLLVASCAAIAVVGGTVLYITHPWNADAFSTKATVPADTSMAGFPGEVAALSGQDRAKGSDAAASAPVESADQTSYATLMDIYGSLNSFSEELTVSTEELERIGVSGSSQERAKGRDAQTDIAVRLSNTISALDSVDKTTGTYTETIERLKTLGNWLRNWSDALSDAWTVSASFEDASGHRDAIFSSLVKEQGEDGKNSYEALFNQNYEAWKPQEPTS
jgi:hypothetical protein